MRTTSLQIVFLQSRVQFESRMAESLPDVVRETDGLYYVSGGFKIGYSSDRLPTQLKVQKGSDLSRYTCGYQQYSKLPRIFLTHWSISLLQDRINVFIKWIYHDAVNIYCCAFAPTVDLKDESKLIAFIKTCKYKQKYVSVSHQTIVKFLIALDVVYFSLQEYDASYITEENTHHDEIDGYNIVLYIHPTGVDEPRLVRIETMHKD
jgi:hypothetical protein